MIKTKKKKKKKKGTWCRFFWHDKVRIKGKVDQSCEWSNAPQHLGVVAVEKGALRSSSTKVANIFYFIANFCSQLNGFTYF